MFRKLKAVWTFDKDVVSGYLPKNHKTDLENVDFSQFDSKTDEEIHDLLDDMKIGDMKVGYQVSLVLVDLGMLEKPHDLSYTISRAVTKEIDNEITNEIIEKITNEMIKKTNDMTGF